MGNFVFFVRLLCLVIVRGGQNKILFLKGVNHDRGGQISCFFCGLVGNCVFFARLWRLVIVRGGQKSIFVIEG